MSSVDDLRIEARRAEADGDFARATRLYMRAISQVQAEGVMPDPGLLVRLGDLEYRQDDPEAALTYYRRAAEEYSDQGLVTNAVAVCNKVLRVFPDNYEFYALLADLHLDIGLTADARGHILRFDQAAPARDDPGHVLDALRSFLEREPDQKVALRLVARLEGRGRNDEALEVLEDVWRERTREDLEVEALHQKAKELDPDIDFEAWSRPRLEVHDGREEARRGAGDVPDEREPLGELGVLDELTAEAGLLAAEDDAGAEEARVHDRDRPSGQIDVLRTLARLVEHRVFEAEQHADRVGELAAQIAEGLGLSRVAVELIRSAAPLHDMGMVVVPDSILLKEGDLTPEEREIMTTHAANGARILSESDLPEMRLASEIALTHHERWDGTGYPRELEGPRIPLSGRIVAVADCFMALTHDRPFREAESAEEALREIEMGRDAQFDPRIVEVLLDLKEDLVSVPAEDDNYLEAL
jgi:putative two-component system response regulator